MSEVVGFVVCLPSGEILRAGTCAADSVSGQAEPGEQAYEGWGGDLTHWVDQGVVVDRPQMPLVVSGVVLAVGEVWQVSGVPDGARLIHPAGEAVVSGGAFEWSAVLPGEYLFELQVFPYLDEVLNVVVA